MVYKIPSEVWNHYLVCSINNGSHGTNNQFVQILPVINKKDLNHFSLKSPLMEPKA